MVSHVASNKSSCCKIRGSINVLVGSCAHRAVTAAARPAELVCAAIAAAASHSGHCAAAVRRHLPEVVRLRQVASLGLVQVAEGRCRSLLIVPFADSQDKP